MLRLRLKSSIISNRLIHNVTRQDNVGKKKIIVLGAGW